MSGPISSPSPNPLGSSSVVDFRILSISSASSSSSLVAGPSSSVSADPKEIRATIIKVIKENQNKTFNETADAVWKELAKLQPEIKNSIEKFKQEYKDKLRDIKDSSWKEKIKEFGDGMKTAKDDQGHTWETFRDDAIQFQMDLVGMAAGVLDITPPGWKEEGTKGYASDVDNVMVPAKGTNELDQMLIKIIADTLWVSVFGNLSGKQVELESYLPQPGLSRNTEKRVDESYVGSFLRLEITMGLLEYYRPFKDGASPNEASVYNEFVKNLMLEMMSKFMSGDQNSISTIQDAFGQIMNDVANFQTEIEIGIRRQVLFQRLKENNPQLEPSSLKEKIDEILDMSLDQLKQENYTKDELQLAHAQYTAPRLLAISQKMDENDRQISLIENRIRETQKFQWLPKNTNASSIKKLIQDRSKLEIENASLGAIRNALFSETYTTQSAMITVGPAESGQMQKKFVDNLLTSFATQLTTSQPAPLIQSPKFQSFSYLNLCMSALENLGKMRAKLEDHGSLDDSALVDASKYLERICFFCNKAVEWVSSDDSEVLKTRSEESLNVASELEKCKRKQKLNPTAAREMLKQHLIKSANQFPTLKLTSEEQLKGITLEKKIDLLLENFFLNIKRYEGEELLKNELFDQLVMRFYADVLYAGQFDSVVKSKNSVTSDTTQDKTASSDLTGFFSVGIEAASTNMITEGEKSYLTTNNNATEPDKQIDLILMALCGYPPIYSDTLSPQESLLVDHLKALKLINVRVGGGFEVPLLKDLYEKQKELTLEKFGLKEEENIKKLIQNVEQHVINVIVKGIELKKFPPPEADQNKFVSLLQLFKEADATVKKT